MVHLILKNGTIFNWMFAPPVSQQWREEPASKEASQFASLRVCWFVGSSRALLSFGSLLAFVATRASCLPTKGSFDTLQGTYFKVLCKGLSTSPLYIISGRFAHQEEKVDCWSASSSQAKQKKLAYCGSLRKPLPSSSSWGWSWPPFLHHDTPSLPPQPPLSIVGSTKDPTNRSAPC